MDFWNNNTTFVTQKKWKMWIQKNVKVMSNLLKKIKTSSHLEFFNEVF
jgi:hypothetical protein